jgi:hypothetical protein
VWDSKTPAVKITLYADWKFVPVMGSAPPQIAGDFLAYDNQESVQSQPYFLNKIQLDFKLAKTCQHFSEILQITPFFAFFCFPMIFYK